MIDITFIRNNPNMVRDGLRKKQKNPALVDEFLAVDEKWRAESTAIDVLRAQLNAFSKERKIDEAKTVKGRIKKKESVVMALEIERNALLQKFPNMPAVDVPVGTDESNNVVLREVGIKPQFDFQPLDYLTIAERLSIIDVKHAAEVAGSRFGYIKGTAALLEFALVQFAMKHLVKKGFIPVIPPAMIKPAVFMGMGRLAADQKDERYYLPADDMYLVGSAEHTVGPLHMNELLRAKDLPKRYVAFSTCFRREAGSYGKDTKGILRVHQFDKVEMFSFSAPEKSDEEHQFLLSCQEELLQELKLPYRVVEVCAGDMGWTDAKQYDLETWLPGQPSAKADALVQSKGVYRETHSCSNTTDFQARGINCRYSSDRNPDGIVGVRVGANHYAHMLNATGFAIGRTIIAIIENYQKADGTFAIPEVLKPYF